jgi:hypothetical protein
MTKIKITKECCCEHDLHELMYPREGLSVREFEVDEEIDFVETWDNCYGRYHRGIKDGKHCDIDTNNSELIFTYKGKNERDN